MQIKNPPKYEQFNEEFYLDQCGRFISGRTTFDRDRIIKFTVDGHVTRTRPSPNRPEGFISFETHVTIDYEWSNGTVSPRYFYIESWDGRRSDSNTMSPESTVDEAKFMCQFGDFLPTESGWVEITPQIQSEIDMLVNAIEGIVYENDGNLCQRNWNDSHVDNNPRVYKSDDWDKNYPSNTTVYRTPIPMLFIHKCNSTGEFICVEEQYNNYNNSHTRFRLGKFEIPNLAGLLIEGDYLPTPMA